MGSEAAAAGTRRRGGSPFGPLRPAIGLALAYAAASLFWVGAGNVLPGGRWLAVHLFTLGVVTNLIAALTQHFAETVMHARSDGHRAARLAVLNIGVVAVLVGLPAGRPLLVAAGATLASVAVLWLFVALRRLRKGSLSGRFGFVVRGYERACGAFLHGAILGGLLGAGLLTGAWYGAARLAHLHVNVLGWAGLTLLSTLVFFGPTILRARMAPGADASAARWIGHAATGLTLATLALLLTGAGGPVALGARAVAVAGLGVYALAVTLVCLPVLRVGRRARPSPHGRLLLGAAGWFPVAAWAATVAVAAGTGRFSDAVGVALLTGVLAQAIVASLAYLSPMVWPRGPERREQMRTALDRFPTVRPVAFNLGAALMVAAAAAGTAAGPVGAGVIRAGWALVAAAMLLQVGLVVVAASARHPEPRPRRQAR